MVKFIRSVALMAVMAVLSSGCVYFARVSVDAGGAQFNDSATLLDVSGDGRYVLFSTDESLDPIDTNGVSDVYRKDNLTGAVLLISRRGAAVGDGASSSGVMSDDGRWVAFRSIATNLVNGDTNGELDVFVHDVQGNTTKRASIDSSGGQASAQSYSPAISGDGRHTAFVSSAALVAADTNTFRDVYRFDWATDTVSLVSSSTAGVVGTSASDSPSVNFDGSLVAFASLSSNLIGSDTNGSWDVFANVSGGPTVRVSVSATGAEANGDSGAPSVSGNGLVVAFTSEANNLTPGDVNGFGDVLVKTIVGPIFLASVADDGVTQGSRPSRTPDMNHDGTLVGFISLAPELSGGPPGTVVAMIRDGLEGRTVAVGVSTAGVPVGSSPSLVSAEGHYVAFGSQNTGVITPDANGSARDLFLRWWSAPEITSISPATISLGASQPVTITGTGFSRFADTSVYTNISGNDGVTFTNVVVVDHTTITADVETVVGTTPIGPKSLWVEAAGEGPGQTSGAAVNCNCLTVAL